MDSAEIEISYFSFIFFYKYIICKLLLIIIFELNDVIWLNFNLLLIYFKHIGIFNFINLFATSFHAGPFYIYFIL